jgi:hypothetical protein
MRIPLDEVSFENENNTVVKQESGENNTVVKNAQGDQHAYKQLIWTDIVSYLSCLRTPVALFGTHAVGSLTLLPGP